MASVNLIKFLDRYVGAIICLVLSIFNIRNNEKKSYKKILIIQLWGIGETVLCLPAIRALKESNKKMEIDVLATERVKDVFYNNKNTRSLKIIELSPFSILRFIIRNWRKYNLAIDMEEYLNISAIIAFFAGKERAGYSHGVRSFLYNKKVRYNDKQHTTRTFIDLLQPLGIKKTIKNLERLNYSKEDKEKVDELLKNYNIKYKGFIVAFGIGAAESVRERMWPEERFAQIADYLIGKYKAKIILFGSKEEATLGEKIIVLTKNKNSVFNFAGKTSVREMFYLASLCRLFIGNDAGPMHVAAAQNVKTIGLFGCNLPVRFKPFGKNGFYIYKKDSQEACINVHKGEAGKCKFGKENACVKKIQVEDVIELVDEIIKK